MNLRKMKFKEIIIPKVSFYLLVLGFVIIILGASANFIVIQNNDRKMPVWTNYNINSDKHFVIRDVLEVEYLHFADIYSIKNQAWSLGDFLLIGGIMLMSISLLIIMYNATLNILIKVKGGKNKNGQRRSRKLSQKKR